MTQKKDPKLSRQLGYASTAGLMLVFCTFIGAGMGIVLDRALHTKPWMMFIFLLLGIISGFYNVYRIIKSLDVYKSK